MNKEFIMRYMVEYGIDAKVPPSELANIGFEEMLHDFGDYRKEGIDDADDTMNFTRGLILLRVEGWIKCDFDPLLISLTQKSKDLLNDLNEEQLGRNRADSGE